MTTIDAARLQDALDAAVKQFDVPGAALGVLQQGRVTAVAAGVLNVETGVEATADSVFQIGSITKSYTATLLLQLADEGALGLDQPLLELLPELDLGDPQAERVTVRHLLAHTSGIQGDHFADPGRGDDVLERYVETCKGLGFGHPVGATMSYCNTGYVLAGRIIEKLTGATWDKALRERLLGKLDAQHSFTLPEDAPRYRVAHGHHDDKGTQRLVSTWGLPRSVGPAGTICASAADVLGFARLHLAGGTAADGTRVLSADSVAEMQRPQVEIPNRWALGSHWGLGWFMFDADGRRVYGHDGNTGSQSAYLRIVPDADTAVVLLANGGHMHDAYQAVFRELLLDACGVALPEPLSPAAEPPAVDVSSRAGVYERVGVRFELEDHDGELVGRLIPTGALAELDEDDDEIDEMRLVPITDSVFVTRQDGDRTWSPIVFYTIADGSPYVHFGARASHKHTGKDAQ
jgi:CubicO group peptidase (beta-lactamase class C family)